MLGKRILAKALAGESGYRSINISRYGKYERIGSMEILSYCSHKIVASPARVVIRYPEYGDFEDDEPVIYKEREIDVNKYVPQDTHIREEVMA